MAFSLDAKNQPRWVSCLKGCDPPGNAAVFAETRRGNELVGRARRGAEWVLCTHVTYANNPSNRKFIPLLSNDDRSVKLTNYEVLSDVNEKWERICSSDPIPYNALPIGVCEEYGALYAGRFYAFGSIIVGKVSSKTQKCYGYMNGEHERSEFEIMVLPNELDFYPDLVPEEVETVAKMDMAMFLSVHEPSETRPTRTPQRRRNRKPKMNAARIESQTYVASSSQKQESSSEPNILQLLATAIAQLNNPSTSEQNGTQISMNPSQSFDQHHVRPYNNSRPKNSTDINYRANNQPPTTTERVKYPKRNQNRNIKSRVVQNTTTHRQSQYNEMTPNPQIPHLLSIQTSFDPTRQQQNISQAQGNVNNTTIIDTTQDRPYLQSSESPEEISALARARKISKEIHTGSQQTTPREETRPQQTVQQQNVPQAQPEVNNPTRIDTTPYLQSSKSPEFSYQKALAKARQIAEKIKSQESERPHQTTPREETARPQQTVSREQTTRPQQTVTRPQQTMTQLHQTVPKPQQTMTQQQQTGPRPQQTMTQQQQTGPPQQTMTQQQQTGPRPQQTMTQQQQTGPQQTIKPPQTVSREQPITIIDNLQFSPQFDHGIKRVIGEDEDFEDVEIIKSGLHGYGTASPHWIQARGNVIPSGTFVGGNLRSANVYVARAKYQGQIIPGSVVDGVSGCTFSCGDDVLNTNKFKVLCAGDCHWISFSQYQANIPDNAVFGGYDAGRGPIYIGRVQQGSSQMVGRVSAKCDGTYECCITDNYLFTYDEFEILVMKQISTPSRHSTTLFTRREERASENTPEKQLITLEQSERTQFIIDKMQNSIRTHAGSYGGNFRSYHIVKIQHIINRPLFREYVNRRNAIARENGGNPNEMQLFHGSAVAKEIAENGFDERYSRISGMFGAGIYFADHSSKSNQYAWGLQGGCTRHNDKRCMQCERLMLLCRVTMGKVAEFTDAQNLLAHAPPSYHSVKGVPSPRGLAYPEYIVYRGEQAFPDFLITYKLLP